MSSCSSSSFSLLKPLTFPSTPCPSPALLFHNNPNYIPFKTTSNHSKTLHLSKRLTIPFALTESDSPKSLQPDLQILLLQLADSFDLPSDYFSQLPNDLRLDLNDAAFDLSNGPVIDEIAKAVNAAGKLLSASSISATTEEQPKTETRMFKFGELQVEVTSEKANIGAAIGFVFGILSWQIAQGIQSIPESSLEYANDNALLLAKSLRGALLAVFYSSTILSVFTTIGLLLLGRQLKSEGK
ncbi:hypothetical protein E1A91_D13G201500v1 [Gossypium mustelinum]|uniref:Uncharacterized protein n=1 Tax=Gossypium mustelinum TaxID=34275 RepID=A0A5D2S5Z2_GOSMU|nr:hypothetical protein E1A91_D13G201500v1 [Gossypium mustelinum]